MKNYYKTLGIPPSATPEAIKSAYRRLARAAHPDSGGTTTGFHSLKEAYELLADPSRRAAYDQSRAAWAALHRVVLCEGCGEANRPARHPPPGCRAICGGCAEPLPDTNETLRKQRRAAVARKATEFVSTVGLDLAETAANAALAKITQLRTRWTKGE